MDQVEVDHRGHKLILQRIEQTHLPGHVRAGVENLRPVAKPLQGRPRRAQPILGLRQFRARGSHRVLLRDVRQIIDHARAFVECHLRHDLRIGGRESPHVQRDEPGSLVERHGHHAVPVIDQILDAARRVIGEDRIGGMGAREHRPQVQPRVEFLHQFRALQVLIDHACIGAAGTGELRNPPEQVDHGRGFLGPDGKADSGAILIGRPKREVAARDQRRQ